MPKLKRGASIRVFALLIAGCAVGLSADTISRRPPAPSAESRASDTPVVDHVPGGGPDGGSVNSLAIVATRPATVFASFSEGGVYKSRDRGETWIPADRGLPDDASCELVSAPAPSSTLYAACGDGLFKTTNGGALWQQLDLDDPVAPVVAPSDPRMVYQPPDYGVVRSRDGGRRWEQIHGSMPTKCRYAFAIDPVDPFVLFCGDDEWVKVSRDGGVSWKPAGRAPHPDAEIASLAIDPSHGNTILAGTSDGRTFKSTTGGATWFHATDGPVGNSQIGLLRFVDTSGDVLFARQGSSIMRSLDGGDHWEVMPSPADEAPFATFVVDPSSPSTVYVGTWDGVMVTTDFGAHWAIRNRGISRATASVALHEGATSTLYASSSRKLFASRDSGDTWTTASNPNAAVAETIAWLTSDGASGVLAQTAKARYRLRSGETTWAPFEPPAHAGPVSPSIASTTGTPLFATTVDGFVFSVDGGSHWRSARLPGGASPSIMAIAAGQPRVIYASTGGILENAHGLNGIWRTQDEGATWQLMDQPATGSIGRCCGLSADPHDRDTLYAVVAGLGIGGEGNVIRRTTDGGLTWSELKLSALSLSLTVVHTVPTTLLAQVYDLTRAGHFVLLKSTDRGDQWIPAGDGLPSSVQLTNIVVDARQPKRLFAGTHGRGVFRSVDAGATWRPTGPLR